MQHVSPSSQPRPEPQTRRRNGGPRHELRSEVTGIMGLAGLIATSDDMTSIKRWASLLEQRCTKLVELIDIVFDENP